MMSPRTSASALTPASTATTSPGWVMSGILSTKRMSPGLVQTVTAGPQNSAPPAMRPSPGPTTPTGPPQSAIWVVAGSPGMTGAADMAARAAMRSGSGTVRLGVPGQPPAPRFPEVIGRELPAEGWDAHITDLDRMKALVIGPGLGRSDATAAAVRRLLATAKVPVVVDADALYALGSLDDPVRFLRARPGPTILTPHDGEFSRLVGCPPGPRRISAVRHLAFTTGATVLLKGSTTVVADPSGDVLLTDAGDARLATAGSGDVLAGVVGALLAQGLDPLQAGAAGAFVHGTAAGLGWRRGLVAGDLLDLLPVVFNSLAP